MFLIFYANPCNIPTLKSGNKSNRYRSMTVKEKLLYTLVSVTETVNFAIPITDSLHI